MEAPNEADTAARMERATRSALASSFLASYSYSDSSTRDASSPPPPSLTDLLPRLGSADAPRCPSCSAALPFGPRSRICLVCAAPLIQSPPFSVTSSLAFLRFSEALHLDDLETDNVEAEENNALGLDVYRGEKSSSSSFILPSQAGGQNISDVSSELKKVIFDRKGGEQYVKTPISNASSSVDLGFMEPAKTVNFASNILDYSSKLEGISLEDFFSSKASSQPPTVQDGNFPIPSESIAPSERKVSWDLLAESSVLDGLDLVASTGATTINTVMAPDKAIGVEDDDDPFSSWEGDFQSAPPVTAEASFTPSFSFDPQLSAELSTWGNFEDAFGNFSDTQNSENMNVQGHNDWAEKGGLFGLHTHSENHDEGFSFSSGDQLKIDTRRGMDIDNLFGLVWQQSDPSSSSTQSATTKNQLMDFPNEQSNVDLLGSSLMQEHNVSLQMDSSANDNSHDVPDLSTIKDKLHMEQEASQLPEKWKIVGSLLAQLHDLSFMLADKLIIKTEGKNTKPDPSS